ncbi:MAG: HAMP domain-containing protein [Armatimonadetes bacterium]|nr:HAMP domain-containing protein [Armatimonadota bacterium]
MLKSVRAKVVLLRTAILAVMLLFFGLALHRQASHGLEAVLDNTLRCQAEYAAYVLHGGEGGGEIAELGEHIVAHRDLPRDRKLIRILNAQGDVLFESGPSNFKQVNGMAPAAKAVRSGELVYETVATGRNSMRLISLPAVDQEHIQHVVQVGTSLEANQHQLWKFSRILFLCGLAILTLVTAGGWWITGAALRPVRMMVGTAKRIGTTDTGDRLEVPDSRDELEELARTFNDMIDRLESASKQMRSFTAYASHQLRTPLTIMKGEIEVALRKPRSAQEQDRVLQSALEEINLMSKIVNDLLTLARADSGEVVLETKPVDLNDVIQGAVSHRRVLAEMHGCSLAVNSSRGHRVWADRDRLVELIENLLDNAIKYTPSGEKITLDLRRDGKGFLISVTDTGTGIASDELDKIFERFYRGKNSQTQRIRGSGLGLSICKWITEAHGGHIRVVSRIGQGSTFSVWLPSLEAASQIAAR